MSRTNYLPTADAALLAWTANFGALITATPTAFGLTAILATEYTAQQTAYATALTAAINPNTRGKRTVFLKTQAKKTLVGLSRVLAQQINKTLTVTNDQRQQLGLTIASGTRTPVPVPAMQPVVTYSKINGRTVTIKLGREEAKRGRPSKVTGATVFTAAAGASLNDANAWSFNTSTTKTTLSVSFPAGDAQTVQITAFWTNARNESGPVAIPITVNLPASQNLPGAVKMKAAA